jgi:hypothetical protein
MPIEPRRVDSVISKSVPAPDANRIVEKLAGSRAVCPSANRQSNELAAKAVRADAVKIMVRVRVVSIAFIGV